MVMSNCHGLKGTGTWQNKQDNAYLKQMQGKGPVETSTMLGKCTMDSTEVANKLAETVNAVHKLKCKEGVPQKYCASSTLNVVSTLSFLGSYLSGAVGKCNVVKPNGGLDFSKMDTLQGAGCGQAALGLVTVVTKVSEIGIWMS